jgi:hypothetical protein
MRGLILSSGLLAAALIVGPQAAVAQTEGKAFCLQGPAGSINCIYESFEQCQQVQGGRSVGGGCVPNPRLGTTGAGGRGNPPSGGGNVPDMPGGGQYLPPPTPR